jgi:uncharacterized protein (DUF488 family)
VAKLANELLTIGYEASTIDAVIESLHKARVGLLIDVRALPQSRKPGFSKRQLAAGLEANGMRYVHLQGLGTPKPGRDAVRAGDVAAMHRIFHAHMRSDRAQADLASATDLARTQRACLLCFERDHTKCHRSIVAEMIEARTGQTVTNLYPDAA